MAKNARILIETNKYSNFKLFLNQLLYHVLSKGSDMIKGLGYFTFILLALTSAVNSLHAAENEANDSFSDYIQNAENEDIKENEETKSGTWINNLVEKVAQTGSQAFSGDDKPVKTIKRSNASVFDISGIMLRMDLPQVMEAMQKRGYRKTSEHMEIPNFIRWRYEEQCRNNGIVGYERIGNCVYLMAKNNNYQYVQQTSFSNFQTKENIDVFFTSNFTGNKVYRVMYQTQAANVVGSGAKAEYLRNIKVFDFWKKISQKYGTPDNKEQITWGLGDKKPILKAQTGRLVLEDPMLLELDYTRMSREDQKFMNTAVYTF